MYLITHWKDKFSIFEQIQTTMAMHDDLHILDFPHTMYYSMKFFYAILTPGRSLPGRRRWWLKDRTLGQVAVASGWRLQRFPILAVLSLAVTFVMSSWQLTTRCALRRSGWRSLDGRTLKIQETVFQSRSFILMMIVLLVYIINQMKKIVTIHHCERKRRI